MQKGEVDYLVFDYLAELTMSLLARAKAKDPAQGYATDFVSLVKEILPDLHAKGIKLVANAGGLNPQACSQGPARPVRSPPPGRPCRGGHRSW